MCKEYHLIDILPEITSRGSNEFFSEANKCLQLDPVRDRTNGFFVACFDRGASAPPERGPAMEYNEEEYCEEEVIVVSDGDDDCNPETKQEIEHDQTTGDVFSKSEQEIECDQNTGDEFSDNESEDEHAQTTGNEFSNSGSKAECIVISSMSKRKAKQRKFWQKNSKNAVTANKNKLKKGKKRKCSNSGAIYAAKISELSGNNAASVPESNDKYNAINRKRKGKAKKVKHENPVKGNPYTNQSMSQKKKKRKGNKCKRPVTM